MTVSISLCEIWTSKVQAMEPGIVHGLNAAMPDPDDRDGQCLVSALCTETGLQAERPARKLRTDGCAVAFSDGIRRIRHIQTFLNVGAVVSPWQVRRRNLEPECVIVWGRKSHNRQAISYASRHGIPVRFLEDGWIRSCSQHAHSRLSYSLLVDDQGVYYDSSGPSALETYLNLPDDVFDLQCTERDLEYARQCRRILVENNITKYNYVRTTPDRVIQADGRALVMVLDQTRDDASVRLGAMNSARFRDMLDQAIRENPEARVVVRIHPDVVSGLRQGYLQSRASELGVETSASGDNPLPWLKAASRVYAGTSQLGFEALLCGCRVTVFGQPFYAGWGLTEDCQPLRRRVRKRTLDQLFHATHVRYARYCCPVSGRISSLHECLEHVKLQQYYFRRNSGRHVAVGFSPWKRRFLRRFLKSPSGSVRFTSMDSTQVGETTVRWSFSERRQINDIAAAAGNHIKDSSGSLVDERGNGAIRVEDGFLRSSGLGSDFTLPASLVFDRTGMYFDASAPSDLEILLNSYQCSEDDLLRARALRKRLLETELTKYNVGVKLRCEKPLVSPDRKTLLVIGQVEEDQSLLRGGCDVRTNTALVEVVRKNNPHAHITYKPHPDVVSGNRRGAVEAKVLERCVDSVDTTRNLLDCLKDCEELHTITSLSGFEAVLRGMRVVTYGLPFYAGWGLTEDRQQCRRRTSRKTIDELVFVCLVLYPHYVDTETGEFITAEQLVEKLYLEKNKPEQPRGFSWIRKASNLAASLSLSD